jgi:hypothetical protein
MESSSLVNIIRNEDTFVYVLFVFPVGIKWKKGLERVWEMYVYFKSANIAV